MTTKSETMDAVVLERTFNAPVARIWRALTTVEELRAWYFCDAVASAYTWRFKAEPGNSPVTWELATEGDRTGVKVTTPASKPFQRRRPTRERTSRPAGRSSLAR